MSEADDVIAAAVSTAYDIKAVLEKPDATGEEVKRAAEPLEQIEKEIERLLANG